MKTKFTFSFLALITGIGLAILNGLMGCAPATSAANGPPVTIPTIALNCTSSDCHISGTYYSTTYLTESTVTTNGVSPCAQSSITTSIARKAQDVAISCNGSGCHGTLNPSQWETMAGLATNSVNSGQYTICSFITQNPVSTGTVSTAGIVTSTLLPLQNITTASTTINVVTWP